MPIRSRRDTLALLALGGAACAWPPMARSESAGVRTWPLGTRQRTGIHDVAPAPDGGVWFTAQRSGHLGWFDPASGRTELVALGAGSAPHGVIQGPDKAAWITDGGQNAIVRVGWPDRAVRTFPLPRSAADANLNTATFDGDGDLWFTGQSGVVGKVATRTGAVTVKEAPRGSGPYGICTTPRGDVWWCSLAGSFIARIDRATGDSQVVEPPTPRQGARRVWSDSQGRIWVSEWLSGNVSMHDPAKASWRTWKLPGAAPKPYAVYVDERDGVWLSDWGSNAIVRFDAGSETFTRIPLPNEGAGVRQILGRPGEVWLPESGTEHITLIRTAA
jgi:virginiamycin B lyase